MRRRRHSPLGENCYPPFPLPGPASISRSSSGATSGTTSGAASAGLPEARLLAAGRGFAVHEYVCHAGPGDRPFEERHDRFTIAAVVGGSFAYRTEAGRGFLYPGALLLGNLGACFECGHEHGTGDRCVSFQFDPEPFGELAATAAGTGRFRFPAATLPPLEPLLPLLAAAERAAHAAPAASSAGAVAGGAASLALEELAVQVAEVVLAAAAGRPAAPAPRVAARDERRISDVLRAIEELAADPLDLDQLAALAGLSKYHFLRTFRRVVGRSPYQYLLITRMRRAALALLRSDEQVSAIAFAAGFGDLSTFNHRFREIFGETPRAYRQRRAPANA